MLDKYIIREDVYESFLEFLCVDIKSFHASPSFFMAWYWSPNVNVYSFEQLEDFM